MTSPFTTDRRLRWVLRKNPDRLVLPGHPDWLYSPIAPVITRHAASVRLRGWSTGSTAVLPDRSALDFLTNIQPGFEAYRPNVVDGSGNRIWVGPDIAKTATNGACEANGYTGLTVVGSSTTQQNVNATANNQVIEGFYVWGQINLGSFTGVIVRNCVVRGPLTRGADTSYIISQGDDLRGALIEDVLIWGRPVTVPATYGGKPMQPQHAGSAPYVPVGVGNQDNYNGWANDGVRGGNYTIRRTEIRRTGDGIGLTSAAGHVTIEGLWIHQGGYSEWVDEDDTGSYVDGTGATVQGNGYYMGYPGNYTHTDGIQFHRGKVYRIRGNVVGGDQPNGRWDHNVGHYTDIVNNDDMYNTGIMFKQEVDATLPNRIEDVIIENNLFGGGIATINHPSGNGNTFDTCEVRNNRFMRKDPGGPAGQRPIYYILTPLSGGQPTLSNFTNNVFDDDGTAVPYSPGA